MQNVVERVLNLLIYLLESPVPVTSNDVRNTVHGYADQTDDAFHRMFERDKQVLRRLGVPLELEAVDACALPPAKFRPQPPNHCTLPDSVRSIAGSTPLVSYAEAHAPVIETPQSWPVLNS